jgi:hypothetical protein
VDGDYVLLGVRANAAHAELRRAPSALLPGMIHRVLFRVRLNGT